MDVFARTFPPVAEGRARVARPTVRRHLPALHRCVGSDDSPVLLTRCTKPDGAAEHLLLLTRRRLVVTRRTGVLRRVRMHLNADLRHLGDVSWHTDDRLGAVELAATAVDGVRERFLIKAARPGQVWQLDALLERVFRAGVPVDPATAIRPLSLVTLPARSAFGTPVRRRGRSRRRTPAVATATPT